MTMIKHKKMIANARDANRSVNMETKIKWSVPAVALFFGFATLAQTTSPAALFDREEEWKQVGIEVGSSESGYSGTAHVGYVTDRNTVRVAAISRQLNGEGKLTPPRRGKRVPQNKFLGWCALKPFMGPYKQEKLPFEIQMNVNPFARSAQRGGARLENKPELVGLTPKLTLQSDSMAREYRLKVGEVETEIQRQLDQQLGEAAASGVVMITLVGLDDLACDLAQGKAWISIAAKMAFESAKLSRQSVITADEFGRIFEQVKGAKAFDETGTSPAGVLSQSAWLSKVVLAGANLGVAVEDQMQIRLGQFGAENLLNLYRQMFVVQKGVVKDITPADYPRLARNLDHIRVANEIDSPVITQIIKVVLGEDQ